MRRVLWSYKTEDAIVADLKRSKSGLVLVGSLDYSLYAFAGPSGRLVWRYHAGEAIRKPAYPFGGEERGHAPAKAGAPATPPGQVFVFTKGAGLTSLDADTGRAQWSVASGDDLLSADERTVYVLSRSGDLVAVNRGDGKVLFSTAPRSGALPVLNETGDGVIYLGMPDGRIMAIGKKPQS
jgi:outer membrane protein assembly factor BamB